MKFLRTVLAMKTQNPIEKIHSLSGISKFLFSSWVPLFSHSTLRTLTKMMRWDFIGQQAISLECLNLKPVYSSLQVLQMSLSVSSFTLYLMLFVCLLWAPQKIELLLCCNRVLKISVSSTVSKILGTRC